MKKQLKRVKSETYYYENDEKIIGIHSNINDNVSYISGNVSYISGDVSGLSGNIDLCEITEEERQKGIKIEDLILEEYL